MWFSTLCRSLRCLTPILSLQVSVEGLQLPAYPTASDAGNIACPLLALPGRPQTCGSQILQRMAVHAMLHCTSAPSCHLVQVAHRAAAPLLSCTWQVAGR